MRKYIENILNDLRTEYCPSVPFRYRRYGALECALQAVGVLDNSGTKFDKKYLDVVDDYIFFKRRYRRLETYPEMIVRLAKEYLDATPEPVK